MPRWRFTSRSCLSRRSLLAGGAATLALAAGPRPLRAAETSDVLVIGAGMSGLYAARLLDQFGIDVKVIEAQTRVGGRVYTLRDAPLQPEAGAQEVGAMYARVHSVAVELGLETYPWLTGRLDYGVLYDGRLYALDEWKTADANPLPTDKRDTPPMRLAGRYMPKSSPLDSLESWLEPEAAQYDISLLAHYRAQGMDEREIPFLSVGLQTDSPAAESLLWHYRRQRVTEFNRETTSGATLEHISGGISRIPEGMAAELGAPVRMGQRVIGIREDADGIEAVCADGTRHRARYAICSLPLTVLRDIAIDPGLPQRQAEAVAAIPYGKGTSVFLPVKEPYWEEDGLPSSMWGPGEVPRVMKWTNEHGSYLWLFYTGAAQRVMQNKTDAERLDFAMQQLAALRPSTVGRVERGGLRDWTSHDFTKGTYATRGPGQIAAYGNIAAATHGRLHFCGEHSSELAYGLEGAMESGERAALQVLERVG